MLQIHRAGKDDARLLDFCVCFKTIMHSVCLPLSTSFFSHSAECLVVHSAVVIFIRPEIAWKHQCVGIDFLEFFVLCVYVCVCVCEQRTQE